MRVRERLGLERTHTLLLTNQSLRIKTIYDNWSHTTLLCAVVSYPLEQSSSEDSHQTVDKWIILGKGRSLYVLREAILNNPYDNSNEARKGRQTAFD